jgi:hypothetical protein
MSDRVNALIAEGLSLGAPQADQSSPGGPSSVDSLIAEGLSLGDVQGNEIDFLDAAGLIAPFEPAPFRDIDPRWNAPGGPGLVSEPNPYNPDVQASYAGPPVPSPEQNYLVHHQRELAAGGVRNPDGSISTVRGMTVGADGRHYLIPTVWDNQILSEDEAWRRANQVGLENFPSGATAQDVMATERRLKESINAQAGGGNMPLGSIVQPQQPPGLLERLDSLLPRADFSAQGRSTRPVQALTPGEDITGYDALWDRGTLNAQRLWAQGYVMRAGQRLEDLVKRQAGELLPPRPRGPNAPIAQPKPMEPLPPEEAYARAEQNVQELERAVVRLFDLNKRAREFGVDPVLEKYYRDTKDASLLESLAYIVKNPEVGLRGFIESLPITAPGLMAGLAGGPVGLFFGPALTGVMAAGAEIGVGMDEAMKEQGLDPARMTEEQQREWLSQPQNITRALEIGRARAEIIGSAEAVGLGLAKFLGPTWKNLAIQGVAQPVLEGGGEAVAGLATTGEFDPAEVAMEAVAGSMSAPVEVATGAAEVVLNPERQADAFLRDLSSGKIEVTGNERDIFSRAETLQLDLVRSMESEADAERVQRKVQELELVKQGVNTLSNLETEPEPTFEAEKTREGSYEPTAPSQPQAATVTPFPTQAGTEVPPVSVVPGTSDGGRVEGGFTSGQQEPITASVEPAGNVIPGEDQAWRRQAGKSSGEIADEAVRRFWQPALDRRPQDEDEEGIYTFGVDPYTGERREDTVGRVIGSDDQGNLWLQAPDGRVRKLMASYVASPQAVPEQNVPRQEFERQADETTFTAKTLDGATIGVNSIIALVSEHKRGIAIPARVIEANDQRLVIEQPSGERQTIKRNQMRNWRPYTGKIPRAMLNRIVKGESVKKDSTKDWAEKRRRVNEQAAREKAERAKRRESWAPVRLLEDNLREASKKDLETKSAVQLKAMATERGLPVTGSKQALMDRITAYREIVMLLAYNLPGSTGLKSRVWDAEPGDAFLKRLADLLPVAFGKKKGGQSALINTDYWERTLAGALDDAQEVAKVLEARSKKAKAKKSQPKTEPPKTEPPKTAGQEPAQPAPKPAPKPTKPAEVKRIFADRIELDVVYELRSLDDITTSDQEGYPPELQPRDRSRIASQDQIRDIAKNLRPAQLMESATADTGAPIIGPDGNVESGNGRIMALRVAAQENPAKYAEYIQALQDAGYDTAAVENPVLVRRRVTDMSQQEREAFVSAANTSQVAAMSSTEQAKQDAKIVRDIIGGFDPDSDLDSANNLKFRSAFVGKLPTNERGGLIDSNGRLSQQGLTRLRNAMLAAAYDDTDAIAQLTEDLDDTIRSVTSAMARVAGDIIVLKQAVTDGKLGPEFDINRVITDAAQKLRQIRADRNQNVESYLGQQSMFDEGDPRIALLLRAFYNDDLTRALGADKVAAFLRTYHDEAMNLTKAAGDFFSQGNSSADILAIALAARNQDVPKQQGMFDLDETTIVGHTARLYDEVGMSRIGLALSEVNFSQRPSYHQMAWQMAGLDPAKVANMPADKKIAALAKVMREIFGFRVVVDPRIKYAHAIHQMLDAVSNLIHMSSELQLPVRAMSLNGTLTLRLISRKQMRSALGMYDPVTKSLYLPDRSNSFSHEWMHGLDNYLVALFSQHANKPGAENALWTSVIQELGEDVPSRTLQGAFLRLVNTLTFGAGEPVMRLMTLLEVLAHKQNLTPTDRRNLKTQIEALNRVMSTGKIAGKGQRDLRAHMGEWVKRIEALANAGQLNPRLVSYYISPWEMLARSFEAYMAHRLSRTTRDTAFVTKPDLFYQAQSLEWVNAIYPQDEQRREIFRLYDELFDHLRAVQVFQGDLPDTATQRANRPAYTPDGQPVIYGPNAPESRIALELQTGGSNGGYKPPSWAGEALGPMDDWLGFAGGFIGGTWNTFRHPIKTISEALEKANRGRQAWLSAMVTRMKAVERRSPNNPYVREWVRAVTYEIGSGKFQPQAFEEAVVSRVQSRASQMQNLLKRFGLEGIERKGKAAQEAQEILYFVMLGMDAKAKAANGGRPVPRRYYEAAAAFRRMLDDEWYQNDKVGMDVGYTKEAYLMRVLNFDAVQEDTEGFLRQARKLYDVAFREDIMDGDTVGNYESLLELAQELLSDAKRQAKTPEDARILIVGVETAKSWVQAIRRVIKTRKQIEGLNEALKEVTERGDADQIRQLKDAIKKKAKELATAEKFVNDNVDAMRSASSGYQAYAWLSKITLSEFGDFDTVGPQTAYTKKRTLPAAAGALMKDFYISNPIEQMMAYFLQSARRTEYAKRFGPAGEKLKQLRQRALNWEQKNRPANDRLTSRDYKELDDMVQAITGRVKWDNNQYITSTLAMIQGLGTLSLLPRAVWSSFHEPISAFSRTGDINDLWRGFAYQMREVLRGLKALPKSERAQEARDIAEFMGLIAPAMWDQVIQARVNSDVLQSQKWQRRMGSFFKFTWLHGVTNTQRIAMLPIASRYILRNLEKMADPRVSRKRGQVAFGELQDLGVPPSEMENLLEFMGKLKNEQMRMPTAEELATDAGRVWAIATTRFVNQVIQLGEKQDRPAMAVKSPWGSMVLSLTQFIWRFWRAFNVRVVKQTISKWEAGRQTEGWMAGTTEAGKHLALLGFLGYGAIYYGAAVFSFVREVLFSTDKWDDDEEDKDDTWLDNKLEAARNFNPWKGPLALLFVEDPKERKAIQLVTQRTGIAGPLEIVWNAVTGIRWDRDLTALTAGPYLGYMLQQAMYILNSFVGNNSPNTNTAEHRALSATYRLFMQPMINLGLAAAPGGWLIDTAKGVPAQYLTGYDVGEMFADYFVGPRGSKTEKNWQFSTAKAKPAPL